MIVSIFGLGYVGCVGMACLASRGHKVIGVDKNETKVQYIQQYKSPIVEPDIGTLLSTYNSMISATTDSIEAVVSSDCSFICVGTPPTLNGHTDLNAIFHVGEEIAEGLKNKESFHVIVIRSTVLPGTGDKLEEIIEKISGKVAGIHFAVVANPEFLREGTAVHDYNHPPYTLIGSDSNQAVQMMRALYQGIDGPFVVNQRRVVEMIKYVNNSFHALKICFANEVGNICKKIGIDSHELMKIFCMDNKLNLSPYYLKPGFSYGGSCLPKDLKALAMMAHDTYIKCPVIDNIELSNELQKEIVLNQIISFGKQKIGFLGLSFKAGTDDLRSSPIIDVIEKLLGKGFDVKIFDRNVQLAQLIGGNREFIMKKIPFISSFIIDDPKHVISQSSVIVIVNRDLEYVEALEENCHGKIVYDLVNIDFSGREDSCTYVGIAW